MVASVMNAEPVLRADDRAAWDHWQRTAAVHARTLVHRRLIERTLRVVDRWLSRCDRPAVSWSGGKDSTVMTHLVCVEHGARTRVTVISEKDDLDYPGEEDYVRGLAADWGIRLEIIRPDVSPAQWIAERANIMHFGDDIHAHSAGLSKACFYSLMQRADEAFDGVALGLRSEESWNRERVRRAMGQVYQLKSGRWRCIPLSDWRGLDVFAYAQSRGIKLLPVYRCLGLMHRDRPWEIRKSWWLPGSFAAQGQIAWLRRYYPSLYRRLLEWFPAARIAG